MKNSSLRDFWARARARRSAIVIVGILSGIPPQSKRLKHEKPATHFIIHNSTAFQWFARVVVLERDVMAFKTEVTLLKTRMED
jgi:hypothetical protein